MSGPLTSVQMSGPVVVCCIGQRRSLCRAVSSVLVAQSFKGEHDSETSDISVPPVCTMNLSTGTFLLSEMVLVRRKIAYD